jgi:hypothetical protein
MTAASGSLKASNTQAQRESLGRTDEKRMGSLKASYSTDSDVAHSHCSSPSASECLS